MDPRPSIELLEANHAFPGVYQFKAIGSADDDFENRVVNAVRSELAAATDLDYTVRVTQGGRHVSLTLHVSVQSAEQVRALYGKLHDLPGLRFLL